jgi:hypothetical protein
MDGHPFFPIHMRLQWFSACAFFATDSIQHSLTGVVSMVGTAMRTTAEKSDATSTVTPGPNRGDGVIGVFRWLSMGIR